MSVSDAVDAAGKLATEAPFGEFEVARDGYRVRGRDFGGSGVPFILLHGFPDNLHIFDQLAPLLAAAGKRVVSFDFLGFGQSDKPAGFAYDFAQQQQDLLAVLDALAIEKANLVAHDAGGVAAINLALDRPERVASLGLINVFYAETPNLRLPERIELFAHPFTRRIGLAALQDPRQLAWLLSVQRDAFGEALSERGRELMTTILQPLIAANFEQQPSAAPAFARMTARAHNVAKANARRLPEVRASTVPVRIVWGSRESYLSPDVAKEIGSQFQRVAYHFVDAGHWPQIELPSEVAVHLIV